MNIHINQLYFCALILAEYVNMWMHRGQIFKVIVSWNLSPLHSLTNEMRLNEILKENIYIYHVLSVRPSAQDKNTIRDTIRL